MNDSARKDCVRKYYDCFALCDRETLTGLLVKDFEFVSSYAEYQDRDVMLNDIWPHVIQNRNRIQELEFYCLGQRLIARYRHAGPQGTSICELFEFEGDKISSVQVFMKESPSETSEDS